MSNLTELGSTHSNGNQMTDHGEGHGNGEQPLFRKTCRGRISGYGIITVLVLLQKIAEHRSQWRTAHQWPKTAFYDVCLHDCIADLSCAAFS